MDGTLRHENSANLQISRIDSLMIAQTIKNGKGLMPPFDLPDSEVAKLTLYVRSLRR